jgi:DNA-binding CsgD family transcriptional regulator
MNETLNSSLYQQEQKNKELNKQLEQANLGLQSLVKTLEEEKLHVENVATGACKDAIQPLIHILQQSHPLTQRQKEILSIIQEILNDLTSPINHQINLLPDPLSPTEIKVANCIKLGRSTNEIAETLCCSRRTAEGHRLSIRRKLNLRPGDNLRTGLLRLSLDEKKSAFSHI